VDDEEDRFGEAATIRNAEDVLRLISADINNDDEMLKTVLSAYGAHEISVHPEVQDLLATSLAVNSYLIEALAVVLGTTAETVIDNMLLELS